MDSRAVQRALRTLRLLTSAPRSSPHDFVSSDNTKRSLAPKKFAAGGAVTMAAGMAPDNPSGEPLSDLVAQLRDMRTGRGPRQAVFISGPSVQSFLGSKHPSITHGVPIPNFDGKGGMLICRDKTVAQQAMVQRAVGQPLQHVIGTLTGAGVGKPIDGTAAVQQVTPEGAVARETLSRAEDVPQTAQGMAEPDRGVRVVTPQQSIARRAEGVQQDVAQGYAGGGGVQPGHGGMAPSVETCGAAKADCTLAHKRPRDRR